MAIPTYLEKAERIRALPLKVHTSEVEVSDIIDDGGRLMKRSKLSETQIVAILKEGEAGRAVAEICREHGIASATYYQWKSKYGGLEASDLKRMRELEDENNRLKRMYADLALENRAIKDLLGKL